MAKAWACAAFAALALAACGGDEPASGNGGGWDGNEGGGNGQTEVADPDNVNANPASSPYLRRLEVPRVAEEGATVFIPHTTQENGRTVVVSEER